MGNYAKVRKNNILKVRLKYAMSVINIVKAANTANNRIGIIKLGEALQVAIIEAVKEEDGEKEDESDEDEDKEGNF